VLKEKTGAGFGSHPFGDTHFVFTGGPFMHDFVGQFPVLAAFSERTEKQRNASTCILSKERAWNPPIRIVKLLKFLATRTGKDCSRRHRVFLPGSGQFHLCIFLAFGLLVQSLEAREIVQKPLDEFVIYNLPTAFKSGNTTFLFPSAISGLYAKSIAIQEQPNADFLISFTPGNYYFTVRALKREAEDHLTVIYNRKAYVLRCERLRQAFLYGDVLSERNLSRTGAPRCP
jgi:hypothetical protein